MIFISKILNQWIKYFTYELYFRINFGNVKNVKTIFFTKFQLQSVAYFVYVSLEILILVIGIILRFGN